MRQVFQNPKSGKTRIEEIPAPMAKSGGILVKNRFSVISVGTERGIIELSKKGLLQKAKERPDYVQKFFMLIKTKGLAAAWRVAQSKLATDIELGYSTSGDVITASAQAEEFKAGDRVACAGQNYASHAEFILVPKNLAVKIPDGVSYEEASFVTLASIAMQGIRQAGLSPGEKVGVVGLGLLGQIATRLLKAYGHPVMGFDINEAQIKFAVKKSGIDKGFVLGKGDPSNAVASFTEGRGLDAVLVYASAKTDAPLKIAVQVSRDRGRVVQIGNIQTNVPWRDFYAKEMSYISSRSYGPGRYDRSYEEEGNDYPIGQVRWTEKRNMEEFLRLLSVRKVSVADLISRRFDIAEAEKAYELVSNPQGLIHGILLSYPAESKIVRTITIPKKDDAPAVSKDAINIGLIGLGSFANSTILPHLKEVKGARLSAVCHSKGLPAKTVAEKYGADYATSDYREILKDKNIDLVICATRHSSHAKIAVEALEAGKNLYMEKPLALNEEELVRVINAAKKSKGRLITGFNRRFSTHFIEAKKEFENSATPIQIVYRVNVGPLESNNWNYDLKEGGRLLGEGIHFVHALQYLTGSKVKRLSALIMPKGNAIAHEENFSLSVEYQNGSVGTVAYSALGNFRLPKEYIEIYGDGKIMIIDNFKSGRVIGPQKTRKINLAHQDKGYTREIEMMVRAIKEGKPSPIPLEELYESHIAAFKALESAKTGETLELG